MAKEASVINVEGVLLDWRVFTSEIIDKIKWGRVFDKKKKILGLY